MRKNCFVFLFCFAFTSTCIAAQKISTFEVYLDKPANGFTVPAKAALDALLFSPIVTGARKNISLKYRLVVFNSYFTKEKAEIARSISLFHQQLLLNSDQ